VPGGWRLNVARLTLASRNLSSNLADVAPERRIALVEGATGPFEDQQVDSYIEKRYGRRE
jgi:hypothetical protein